MSDITRDLQSSSQMHQPQFVVAESSIWVLQCHKSPRTVFKAFR